MVCITWRAHDERAFDTKVEVVHERNSNSAHRVVVGDEPRSIAGVRRRDEGVPLRVELHRQVRRRADISKAYLLLTTARREHEVAAKGNALEIGRAHV